MASRAKSKKGVVLFGSQEPTKEARLPDDPEIPESFKAAMKEFEAGDLSELDFETNLFQKEC